MKRRSKTGLKPVKSSHVTDLRQSYAMTVAENNEDFARIVMTLEGCDIRVDVYRNFKYAISHPKLAGIEITSNELIPVYEALRDKFKLFS